MFEIRIFGWYLAFEKFDSNGDGVLCQKEFEAVLKEHGMNITEEEVSKFFKDLDADGNKRIDYKV